MWEPWVVGDLTFYVPLSSYITLFNLSITTAKKSQSLEHRILGINSTHTYAVYRNTCRGLFEKDKLLFSFHLNAKILESQKKLNLSEYNFFLRGGQVLDRSTQAPNPASDWMTESAWDNITELNNNIGKFNGLVNSIETNLIEWRAW
jgi:dynein heavy chain